MQHHPIIQSFNHSIIVSVVVCVYNEAGNIGPLVEELRGALRGRHYELIYVNDGSTDGTLAELEALDAPELVVVDLARNYGQSQALAAGFAVAQGTYVVTLDGDLQHDPADIPRLLALAESGGYDMVGSVRANRQDGFWLRKVPSRFANALIRKLTGVYLSDYGSSLRVFRAELAKRLPLYGELHRFIPVLAHLEGARMTEVPVNHRARIHGRSKYGLGRTMKVISDLMLLLFLKRYNLRPMHFFGHGALAMWAGSTLLYGFDGWHYIRTGSWPTSSFLAPALLLGGFQFLGMGLIAELLVRIYYSAGHRTTYHIRNLTKKS